MKTAMTDLPTVSRTAKINKKHSVTLTFTPDSLTCEWDPTMPAPGELSQADLDRYRDIRNELVAEIAQHLGGGVLVVER
jgi:hypothetical protein